MFPRDHFLPTETGLSGNAAEGWGEQLLVKLRLQILIPKFMLPDRLFMAAYWRGVRRSGNCLLTQGVLMVRALARERRETYKYLEQQLSFRVITSSLKPGF